MINISKALMMSFAFLILTGLSYAGSENIQSDIKSPVTNETKEKPKENKADSNKEKDMQPKEKQGDSSSQALKKR